MATARTKVLVFSFFTRDDRLPRRAALAICGWTDARSGFSSSTGRCQRSSATSAVNRFRDDAGPVVLLSSEVGSEGLDFQFCATMFNYDLPWNPMRVEQRIGRLDRYGQEAEVIHIFNMVVERHDRGPDLLSPVRAHPDLRGIDRRPRGDPRRDEQGVGFQRDVLPPRSRGRAGAHERPDRRRDPASPAGPRPVRGGQQAFPRHDDVFLERFNDIERESATSLQGRSRRSSSVS